MRRVLPVGLLLVLSLLAVPGAHAQNWGRVEGRVVSDEDGPLPGVTVVVVGTNFGTATGADGAYDLALPAGVHALRFSSIGFAPHVDTVEVSRDRPVRLDVTLAVATMEMEGLTVEDRSMDLREAGAFTLRPEDAQNIPAPMKDALRALKVMPGVASNNELSNQYSVRGGGFNENLIFVNGFEVHLPFRPRQGEQEGLSLVNAELAERITFYAGGFPARYGGKLSSALDVQYRRPQDSLVRGAAYASLLDAGLAAAGAANEGRLGWTVALRKAQAHRFFSTQDLKGTYQPDYTDLQATLAYRLAPGHEIEALGIVADHSFALDPRSRKTYFGTVSNNPNHPSNFKSLWLSYADASEEIDGYTTRFGGVRLRSRLTDALRMEHDAAFYETEETEYYRLTGSAVLYQVDPGGGDPNSGAGHVPLGTATPEEAADNRVRVRTLTANGRWLLGRGRHAAEAGYTLRGLRFSDELSEKSIVRGYDLDGEPARFVVDSLADASSLGAVQAGFHVEDAVDVLPTPDRLVVTAGARADYFSFNGEWTFSPRLSARYRLTDRTTLVGAAGVYHQAPSYRELRGKPVPGETLLGALNRDIRSQRAFQVTAGGEVFLPDRRLYLRAEAYAKRLDRLISYDIENVRVAYSGENDAEGHAYGADVQLRGEFVPGLESWVNYSYLVARERFLPGYETDRTEGLLARPTDQRHTFSAYVQDYIPGDPTWKVHMRGLFGTGLPYTPPVPGPEIGGYIPQIPGDRASARYPNYMRLDLGLTKAVTVFEHAGAPFRLELTGEILNVFNMINTVAYAWIPGSDGIWQRIPTRLTPRTINVRARVAF